jgi:pyridoxal phosphate enzyme (YggS family)
MEEIMTGLAENLESVRGRIEAAARAAGRDPEEITLVAVSKRHPRERILEAQEAGLNDFGENYVQEALDKFPVSGARLHFIGPLQRNKVRKILPLSFLLHGVGSRSVLEAIERIAGELGLTNDLLLQLHLTDEATKSGFDLSEFRELLPDLADLRHARVRGLMCMGPLDGGPAAARPVFARARGLLDELRQVVPQADTLSMGMSEDLEVAIAEGSTMVRVGTALFGARSGVQ